jgi:hypothetical protein
MPTAGDNLRPRHEWDALLFQDIVVLKTRLPKEPSSGACKDLASVDRA